MNVNDNSILEWLAASMNSAPRQVEVMGLALQEEISKTDTKVHPYNTFHLKDHIEAVLQNFESKRGVKYSHSYFPTGKYLHALLNSKSIDVDAKVYTYIKYSVFTNSIQKFPMDKDDIQSLIPESALALLVATKLDAKNGSGLYEETIKSELDRIWS